MAIPIEHSATTKHPAAQSELQSAAHSNPDKSGGSQRWRKIFKRAVSEGPHAKLEIITLLMPSNGFSQITSSGDERRSANGASHQNGNASSSDTHIGNLSLSSHSIGGTAGDGSLSSIHLPLTPNQVSGSRDYALEDPYSISTERSSGSSGIPLGSPLPQTAKSRYFPFASSSGSGPVESASNSRIPNEKKDKYRTLGKKAAGSARENKAFYSVSSTHGEVRDKTLAVTNEVDTEKPSSATQRFIRRVASAPNAKGLFSSGSMFNKGSVEPPLPSKMTGLGLPVQNTPHLGGAPSPPMLGLSNVDTTVIQAGSHSPSSIVESSISEHAVSESGGALSARHPMSRLLSGTSNLTPGASTASLVSTSTSTYSAAQSGTREHRAQSVGTTGKSALSPGMARLGAAPGPGFRRTYSSNSIKSKTVSWAFSTIGRRGGPLTAISITGGGWTGLFPKGSLIGQRRCRQGVSCPREEVRQAVCHER